MAGGRPTDYTPELGEQLIAIMRQGYSITAAAAQLGFHRDTIYEWASVHPEFSDALKQGRGLRVFKLETDLLSAPDGPTVTARIFALKNAAPDEWRDRHEVKADVQHFLLEVPAEATNSEEWAKG
jgi:transposase-like protein